MVCIRYFTTGAHAHRMPLSYPALAPLVAPFATEGGPCNPAKRSKLPLAGKLNVLNTSTWWVTAKSSDSGFALQYHKATMAGGMAVDKMRAKRAAKGESDTNPYRIIVASPPYQAIATAADWHAILDDWAWMESPLFPLAGLHGVDGVALSVPSVVSASGARPIAETTFAPNELELFHRSADALRDVASSLR